MNLRNWTETEHGAKMMQGIAPFSRKSTVFSGGSYVDIVGAGGSTPPTPTNPINDLAAKDIAAGRFEKPWTHEKRPYFQPRLRVLVGCECSGAVRRAFRNLGHDAWSCDLKPAEDGSPYHIQGDVLSVLDDGWDLGIFHPTCRYLANSGAKHLYIGMKKENGRDEERWRLMHEGAAFFRACLDAPIPRIAVENPIMLGYAMKLIGARPTQVIQPWQFGHEETKATCLWLKRLRALVPTNIVGPPPRDPKERKSWERVFRAPPGPDREADRSRTYNGIAEAFAVQWGCADPQLTVF